MLLVREKEISCSEIANCLNFSIAFWQHKTLSALSVLSRKKGQGGLLQKNQIKYIRRRISSWQSDNVSFCTWRDNSRTHYESQYKPHILLPAIYTIPSGLTEKGTVGQTTMLAGLLKERGMINKLCAVKLSLWDERAKTVSFNYFLFLSRQMFLWQCVSSAEVL